MVVNWGMILLAALANFVIGFLFHGPIGGKLWMKLANIVPTGNEKLSDMVPQMVKNYLVNVVFAYTLAMFIASSSIGGVVIAFWVWLGFTVTTTSINVIWMKASSKLWLYECGVSLLSILAMGAILAK